MRFILLLVLANVSAGLSLFAQGPGNLIGQNLNYQVKNQIKVRGITSEASIPTSSSQTSQTVIYMDDLGRPVQSVATQASPSQTDVIQVSKYDNLGREAEKLLSYTAAQSDGRYRGAAISEIYTFYSNMYGDNDPLAKSFFGNSPLSRLLEQGGVGTAWQPNTSVPADGKTQKFLYGTNTGSEVLKWAINSADNTVAGDISSSFYPANTLQVSTSVDDSNPDHPQTKVYKDFLGNTVLRKHQISPTTWAETYYIYDKFGQLRIVLPPKAVDIIKTQNITSIQELPAGFELITEDRSLTSYTGVSYAYMPGVTVTLPPTYTWSPTFVVKPYDSNGSLLGQYAFQYLYDKEGRKIAEKSPGTEWLYFVYDKSGQLVLSQDGKQRLKDEWTFYKYDVLGRPALTGLAILAMSVDQIRTNANNHSVTFEDRGSAVLYYTNNAYPSVSDPNAYLSATYYDDIKTVPEAYSDYQDPFNIGNLPGSVLLQMNNTASNKGLLTHTKSRILGTTQWMETSYFYDKYHNNVYTSVKETTSDGGRHMRYFIEKYYHDVYYNRLEKVRRSANTGQDVIGTLQTYEYHVDSVTLSQEYLSIIKGGVQPEVISASYVYNDLGQVIDKKIHCADNGATWLQSLDYQYNIQGALTAYNNLVGNTGETDYFGFDITFNNAITNAGNTPRYDGLVSAMRWKDDLTSKENLYNFGYDQLSRLTSSVYKKGVSGAWSAENKYTENNLSYDLNGNILTLNRYQGSGLNTVDQLGYDYGTGGNQLLSVTDVSPGGAAGFADGNSSGEDYAYDANGNLILDQNKAISAITYNYLNLPTEVIFNPPPPITSSTIKYIRYSYNAHGTKLSQSYFNASNEELLKTTYLGEFIAINGLFQSILTSHGRVVAPSYTNLISSREANSLEGFSNNGSVTLSTIFQNDETYVKAVCNQSTSTPGIWPIGGTITVKEGERYSFKVLGYRETTHSAHLYVKGNINDIIWTGELMPEGQANENYVTNEFLVPAGVTQISVGVLWSNPANGATFYINRVALYKLDWEHQYFLTDHLGSPRVVLGSNKSVLNYIGTFETENRATDDSTFLHVEYANVVPHTLANATLGGNEVIRLNNTYRVGPAKSFKVFPGDKIDASVYAYYEGVSQMTKTPVETMATALATAMSPVVTGIDGAITTAYTNSEAAVPGFLLSTFQGSDKPSAFINYILFDESYTPIEAKSVPVGGTANLLQQISLPQIEVKELGYLFIYLSYDNESASWVHFDEFKITYEESPVIQVNAYYPYGMIAYSWIRDGEEDNKFLYQGKEFDSKTGMHDFGSRQYHADLGRWFAMDPQGQFTSPYLAMANNPVSTIDPNGEIAIPFIIAAAAVVYQGVRAGVKAHQAGGSFLMDGFIPAFMLSAGSSMAAGGIGSVFSGLSSTFAVEAGRAISHGAVSAGFSEITGGNPGSGFLTGFAGSLVGSGLNNAPVGVELAGAALSGGIASEVTGGDFWDGFIYAGILATANHLAHRIQAQQGFDGLFKSFREKYYGGTISAIESMTNPITGENWAFDWGIIYGDGDLAINSNKPGGTAPDYSTNKIIVRIHGSAFKDPKRLALVLGHEMVHARDIGLWNEFRWSIDYPEHFETIMEYHAWEWTLQAEQNPRINMMYGEGAQYWLNKLGPELPAGFKFNDYPR